MIKMLYFHLQFLLHDPYFNDTEML